MLIRNVGLKTLTLQLHGWKNLLPVDLPVLSLDAAGEQGPRSPAGGGESLVQVEHGLHQLHHAVVPRGILLLAESITDLRSHQFFQRPIVSRASLSETILS